MNRDEVSSYLRGRIAEVCGVPERDVTDDSLLIGLGLDSVRLVDLVIGIEEVCDIEVDEQDPRLARVKSVQDLTHYVCLRLRECA